MESISLCMIVRDEEAVLARSLESASVFADELIIVDTGSADGTKEIAARYTNQIYDYKWHDDFAAARNYAYSFAKYDYIMWLDADDVIDTQAVRDILLLKENLTDETDVVSFLYGSQPEEQFMRGNDFLMRDRLIKRSLNAKWLYPVHESIPMLPEYKIMNAAHIVVRHHKEKINDKRRNIRIMDKMAESGAKFDVNNRYYYCRELYFDKRYEESLNEYNNIKESGHAALMLDALPYAIWGLKDQKRYEDALRLLLDVLEFAVPDELVCCELGGSFLRERRYDQAKYWLEQARETKIDYEDYRPHFFAYSEFLPCLQLGVMYARLGEWKEAYRYNKRACGIFPNNIAAAMNRKYYSDCIRRYIQK